MPRATVANKHQCHRCGQVFTSLMRLQHHRAAEHAPKTLKDIRAVKDIPTMRDLPRAG